MSGRHVVVVGSGPSGVHFALTALRRGWAVTMVDVGRQGGPPVMPDATFTALKDRLADPAEYFLGGRFDGVLLPDQDQEFYGIPPHKQYIFDRADGFEWAAQGFAPLFSFAQGGLAEAWTAGCYPFNDEELSAFPFGHRDIAPHYDEVARRIGVTGSADDLARFMPVHAHLLDPLPLDAHTQLLLAAYARRRAWFHRALRTYMGLTRVATLSRAHDGREPCRELGRCLWGCPVQALYTPSITLRDCQRHPAFTYRGGLRALFVRRDDTGRAQAVVASGPGGATETIAGERVVLAAGALCSTEIFLRSIAEATGNAPALGGLMDNRQILVPFLTLRMLGKPVPERSYQYHVLGMGVEMGRPDEYVHAQVTTLTTALMHPIIQRLPLDLRSATLLARATHAALGVVNVNLHDTRRADNTVSLQARARSGQPRLALRYRPAAVEAGFLDRAVGRVRRALWALGAIVPPGMTHVRPMGASVHYAGTLPMTRDPSPWTTTPHGESRDIPGLYLADGATFPFLPAKNITFTLMANAVRIAEAAF